MHYMHKYFVCIWLNKLIPESSIWFADANPGGGLVGRPGGGANSLGATTSVPPPYVCYPQAYLGERSSRGT